jgi:hypothetical protein
MAAPVAASRGHDFVVEKIPRKDSVRLRCESCDVTFAEFPVHEGTRITIAMMMSIVEKAVSSVRSHADILGSCKQVHEPMRVATLDDILN